jgi:hypothetical protein
MLTLRPESLAEVALAGGSALSPVGSSATRPPRAAGVWDIFLVLDARPEPSIGRGKLPAEG